MRIFYYTWSTALTITVQVVELDALYRSRLRKYQMHSYFYGERLSPPPGMPPLSSGPASTGYVIGGEQNIDLTLSPSSFIIPFSDLTIWRIGEGPCLITCSIVSPSVAALEAPVSAAWTHIHSGQTQGAYARVRNRKRAGADAIVL